MTRSRIECKICLKQKSKRPEVWNRSKLQIVKSFKVLTRCEWDCSKLTVMAWSKNSVCKPPTLDFKYSVCSMNGLCLYILTFCRIFALVFRSLYRCCACPCVNGVPEAVKDALTNDGPQRNHCEWSKYSSLLVTITDVPWVASIKHCILYSMSNKCSLSLDHRQNDSCRHHPHTVLQHRGKRKTRQHTYSLEFLRIRHRNKKAWSNQDGICHLANPLKPV